MSAHFTVERRAAYVKWLVFGVGLPLLPFAGRALAVSIDRGGLSWSDLLGDGELLVIATVLSAAVIGDLLFDFTGVASQRNQLRVAVVSAVALVLVVGSVLCYGVVTLDNEHRADAAATAQVQLRQAFRGSSALESEAAQSRSQADALSQRRDALRKALSEAEAALAGEIGGASGTGTTGSGPAARELRQEIAVLQSEIKRNNQQAAALTGRAQALTSAAQRNVADRTDAVQRTRTVAVNISVALFALALCLGLLSIATAEAVRRVQSSIQQPMPTADTAVTHDAVGAPEVRVPVQSPPGPGPSSGWPA